MPRAEDLSDKPPKYVALVLAKREAKKREYQRKREIIIARNNAWRLANPEKYAASAREWKLSNPERKAANTRASYERNREDVLRRQRERDRALCDATVRSAIARRTEGLCSQDIPDELVGPMRYSLLIRRELRAIRKANQ